LIFGLLALLLVAIAVRQASRARALEVRAEALAQEAASARTALEAERRRVGEARHHAAELRQRAEVLESLLAPGVAPGAEPVPGP
jgi:hypothetical protein